MAFTTRASLIRGWATLNSSKLDFVVHHALQDVTCWESFSCGNPHLSLVAINANSCMPRRAVLEGNVHMATRVGVVTI